MNCAELNERLDLLMDGELTDDQRRDMEAHGRDCSECAEAIRQAMQLKALFEQMESEVDVPLEAQARWRGAVREAARQGRRKRVIRWIGSAAAAVVVLVGVGLALNQNSAPRRSADTALTSLEEAAIYEESAEADGAEAEAVVPMMKSTLTADASEGAVIEADGLQALTEIEDSLDLGSCCAALTLNGPVCEFSVSTEDVDAACRQISDLAQEYEGEADVQRLEDDGANLYVTIDAANAADFLKAVEPMDIEGRSAELSGLPEAGTTLLLLTVSGK